MSRSMGEKSASEVLEELELDGSESRANASDM